MLKGVRLDPNMQFECGTRHTRSARHFEKFILWAVAMFLSVGFERPAWPQQEPCVTSMFEAEMGQIQNLSAVIERDEASPFRVACHEPPGLLRQRPPTGLFRRQIPVRDSRGRNTRDFLRRIRERVQQKITENRNMLRSLETCLTRSRAPDGCEDLHVWADRELPAFVAEARQHLALAQTEHQVNSWFSRPHRDLNLQLSPQGTEKMVPWAPLTETERELAQERLRGYNREIRSEVERRMADGRLPRPRASRARVSSSSASGRFSVEADRFAADAMLAQRFTHAQSYHAMISEIPLLQYLSSAQPSREEILGAVRRMQDNLRDEEKMAADAWKELESAPAERIPASALHFLRYQSFVEEELVREPADCGLITSVSHTQLNRDLGTGLAIGLPILAASIFAPPLAAFGIGAVAGLGFAYDSQLELDRTRTIAFSQLYADPAQGETRDVEAAGRARDMNLVLLPLSFGGAAAATRTIAVRMGAAQFATSLEQMTPSTLAQAAAERFRRIAREARSRR